MPSACTAVAVKGPVSSTPDSSKGIKRIAAHAPWQNSVGLESNTYYDRSAA
ncbi:hypothetical protein LJK88_34200 [Paenibacillus sp. P26]|nr:hypothetical protein LJK88_34200 [Paenibacillus sp. P26]